LNSDTSLFKKFIGTAGLKVVNKAILVVSGVILARYLGPEQYGLYSYVLSIIALATIPVIAGLPQLLVREIAYTELYNKVDELKGLLNWATIYTLSVSILVVIGIMIYLSFGIGGESTTELMWIALFVIPLKGLLLKNESVLVGHRFPVMAQLADGIVAPLLTLVMLSLLIANNKILTGVISMRVIVISLFSAAIFSLLINRKTVKSNLNKITAKYNIFKWHRAMLPFTLLVLVTSLNNELASVMLGYIVDKESVAFYRVAMQGVGLIALTLQAINMVTGPKILRLYKKNEHEATQLLIRKSVKLSCMFSLPIALTLIIFGEWIIVFMFGDEYLSSVKILRVLCIGQIFNVLMGSVGLVSNMTGHENRTLRYTTLAMLVNVMLLLILIPVYQEIGAAIAVSISMVLWNVTMAIDVYRVTRLKTWLLNRGPRCVK